jgi:hypothetical protein
MFPLCECAGICEFEQDSSLFPNIALTAEVNAQVERARGVVVTPKLYRKLGYRAYFQAVFGYLGHGVRHPPKACILELKRAEWPEPHGASDHVGFYDAPQEDGGHRLLIGREVNEDNTVDVQDAVAKPTPEVMAIEITAVATMDDADAVDCQHGEDEALEATKRSSAATNEHACGAEALEEAEGMGFATVDKYVPAAEGMLGVGSSFSRSRAVAKSLPAVDGMVGGCASFSCSCATKTSSAVTKEHACEAEALEEAEGMGFAAVDKSVPATEGIVGVSSSFSRSRAVAKSLPAADEMVCGCASFSRSHATKRSSAVMKEHACEAALDKSLPASEGKIGACEADMWSQREDHIHARGAMSSAALSLDMRRGTSVPIGSNTVTAIALSPPARLYCHAAAREYRAAAMTSYVEASSRAVKDSHSVIDLSQDTTTPFAAVVNGCTCAGCTDLKAGVIYKMKCYNCVHRFKSTPKCLSIHQDTISCRESCGASLCPKCHTGGVLIGEHQQCATCGQHTCHLCMNVMDYVTVGSALWQFAT